MVNKSYKVGRLSTFIGSHHSVRDTALKFIKFIVWSVEITALEKYTGKCYTKCNNIIRQNYVQCICNVSHTRKVCQI